MRLWQKKRRKLKLVFFEKARDSFVIISGLEEIFPQGVRLWWWWDEVVKRKCLDEF